MCGRYNLLASPEQVKVAFCLQRLPRYERSFNIAPGQKILTIVPVEDNTYKAVNLFWGLIPSWSKDKKISHHLINARAETVAERPSFRAAFKQRRCLIPSTGFLNGCIRRKQLMPITFARKTRRCLPLPVYGAYMDSR